MAASQPHERIFSFKSDRIVLRIAKGFAVILIFVLDYASSSPLLAYGRAWRVVWPDGTYSLRMTRCMCRNLRDMSDVKGRIVWVRFDDPGSSLGFDGPI